MDNPFFSIVIPTRNRHVTLPFALLTCLNQVGFEDYEVIISDNSDENERAISYKSVEPYLNEKVRYVSPPSIMSMTEHWEFALQYVQGQYVTYLGDDDGLMRDALVSYHRCIQQTGASAVMSNYLVYTWPHTYKSSEKSVKNNTLDTYLWSPHYWREERFLNLETAACLKSFLHFKFDYQQLPCIYRGVVSTNVVMEMKKRLGKFFDSPIPDVYSAIMVASNIKSYECIKKPIRVIGTSSFSNGLAFFDNFDGDSLVREDFMNKSLSNVQFPLTPDAPYMLAIIWASQKGQIVPCYFSFYGHSLGRVVKEGGFKGAVQLLPDLFRFSSHTDTSVIFILSCLLFPARVVCSFLIRHTKKFVKFFLAKMNARKSSPVIMIKCSPKGIFDVDAVAEKGYEVTGTGMDVADTATS